MRKTFVLVCTVSVVTLLAGQQSASAGPERAATTCQGQVATIEGHQGQQLLSGTDGPDVIVTNGARNVMGLGGNDLICVTGNGGQLFDAGDGDDTVDAHTRAGFTRVALGAGSDHFLGGPGFDRVEGDTFEVATDADADVIDVGDGGARVGSGMPDQPNGDQVTFGRPDKGRRHANVLAYLGYQTGDGRVDFGPVAGELWLPGFDSKDSHHILIDNRSQVARDTGRVIVHWTGSVNTFLGPFTNGGDFRFRGGPAAETLQFNFSEPQDYRVRMGGGDDEVSYQGCTSVAPGTMLAAGSGHDLLLYSSNGDCSSTVLDLPNQSITQAGTSGTFKAAVVGFEDAKVDAPIVSLRGDGADNRLVAFGCDLNVLGGGGSDTLITRRTGADCTGSPVARGGPGDDTLIGSSFDDTLIGGAGRDNANGKLGHDTCRAEVTRNCE